MDTVNLLDPFVLFPVFSRIFYTDGRNFKQDVIRIIGTGKLLLEFFLPDLLTQGVLSRYSAGSFNLHHLPRSPDFIAKQQGDVRVLLQFLDFMRLAVGDQMDAEALII